MVLAGFLIATVPSTSSHKALLWEPRTADPVPSLTAEHSSCAGSCTSWVFWMENTMKCSVAFTLFYSVLFFSSWDSMNVSYLMENNQSCLQHENVLQIESSMNHVQCETPRIRRLLPLVVMGPPAFLLFFLLCSGSALEFPPQHLYWTLSSRRSDLAKSCSGFLASVIFFFSKARKCHRRTCLLKLCKYKGIFCVDTNQGKTRSCCYLRRPSLQKSQDIFGKEAAGCQGPGISFPEVLVLAKPQNLYLPHFMPQRHWRIWP